MSVSGEHDRLIGNLVMLGVVVALDEARARVRVNVDGMLTDWLAWVEPRAGPGLRTWSAPEIGEQVLLVCPYGDPAQGVVIGSVFQQAFPAPAPVKTIHRQQYADGTIIEYDRAAKRFKVDVGTGSVVINCATATVAATQSITLDTPNVYATGNITATGEVKAGTIGLKAHKHTAQGATAVTTAAQP